MSLLIGWLILPAVAFCVALFYMGAGWAFLIAMLTFMVVQGFIE